MITAIIHQPRAQHHLSRNRSCPLQRLFITLVDRSKVSDKSFDAESRLFSVLSKFGVLEHQETKSSFRRAGGDQESARTRQQVLPVQEVLLRRVQNTGTRASVKRTLSRAVEAATEGTPQNVSFDSPFLIGKRVLSVKMKFFIEKGRNALNRE